MLHELMDLRGRTAIVTGAAGGIGRVIVDTLAELGAQVVLVDLPDALSTIDSDEVRARWSVDVLAFPCDLESEEDRTRLIRDLQSIGSISILVNNAALVGNSALGGWAVPLAQQSLFTWRRALEVNLTAAFHLVQGLHPALAQRGDGSVINISSIYGSLGPDYSLYQGTTMGNPAAYAVSKGGLAQLTRWLATTIAPAVRVNCIAPGGVLRNQPQEFVKRYESRTPLRRMAREADFAGAIAYLATDLSSYVTGQLIAVDGGWGVW